MGQQLVGRQAEMEALGVDEVLGDLGELQVAEKEKLCCELTLQARLTSDFWQESDTFWFTLMGPHPALTIWVVRHVVATSAEVSQSDCYNYHGIEVSWPLS